MPDLTAGKHTLEIAYDTGTALGVLTEKREVTIEDPIFRKLAAAYTKARKADDSAGAARARNELLSRRAMRVIGRGEPVPIVQLNKGPDVPHQFSANATWYPGKDSLNVVVDAVDANYAAGKDAKSRLYRGFVDIYVCPSGSDEDINRLHVIGAEDGPEKANVHLSPNAQMRSRVKATWKRTDKGYSVTITIPWSALKGYRADWKLMPVEATVCSKWRNWSYFIMNKPGEPETSARTYAALRR